MNITAALLGGRICRGNGKYVYHTFVVFTIMIAFEYDDLC